MELSKKEAQARYRASDRRMQLVASAKFRAKRDGVKFDLQRSDIIVPTHCPIYGILLIFGVGKGPTDNSPTLDRVHPHKGYVKDNVRVISHRANHRKQNNTIEDFELFIRYMKGTI